MTKKDFYKLAVLGSPIKQSLSPRLHGHWLRQLGIAGTYEAIEVKPEGLTKVVDTLKSENYVGWNITVPYKEEMFQLVDILDDSAKVIGAVNTVKYDNGQLIGYNTDADGFLRHLNNAAPEWPQDRPALILGAGGAARAVLFALKQAGLSNAFICNRTQEKARELSSSLSFGEVLDWDERNGAASEAGLIVNTTSLGMVDMPALEMSLNLAARDTVVYDIVYKPLMTELLKQAENRGLTTVNGLGMLYYQAVAAFSIWFDLTPEDDGFYEKLADELS